jgi:hypothetical protein
MAEALDKPGVLCSNDYSEREQQYKLLSPAQIL